MPCVAMWRTSPSSILFQSSPAFCHVFFPYCGLILAMKKMTTHIMHLHECSRLDPECAFKAKHSVPVHFGALVCPMKLSGSAESGFFHMKNCRPGTCLTHFGCEWALALWDSSRAIQSKKMLKEIQCGCLFSPTDLFLLFCTTS